jgi:acyl carrier protein
MNNKDKSIINKDTLIKIIIKTKSNLNISKLRRNEKFILDSLEIVILIMELKKKFNISIPGKMIILKNFNSLNKIYSLCLKFYKTK